MKVFVYTEEIKKNYCREHFLEISDKIKIYISNKTLGLLKRQKMNPKNTAEEV
jgi:hypothetical protein